MAVDLTIGLAILSIVLGAAGIILYFIGRHQRKSDIEKIISETAIITAEMLNQERKIGKDDDTRRIRFRNGKVETVKPVSSTLTAKYDIKDIVKKAILIMEKLSMSENVVVVKNPKPKVVTETDTSHTTDMLVGSKEQRIKAKKEFEKKIEELGEGHEKEKEELREKIRKLELDEE